MGEIVLGPHADDVAHPAFGKLFIETEYLPDSSALLCGRRPRSPRRGDRLGRSMSLSVEGRTRGLPSGKRAACDFWGAAATPDRPSRSTDAPSRDHRRRPRSRSSACVAASGCTRWIRAPRVRDRCGAGSAGRPRWRRSITTPPPRRARLRWRTRTVRCCCATRHHRRRARHYDRLASRVLDSTTRCVPTRDVARATVADSPACGARRLRRFADRARHGRRGR